MESDSAYNNSIQQFQTKYNVIRFRTLKPNKW